MRILHILSPKRLIRFVSGHADEADGLTALGGLNDHYLRDIGYRRERPDRRGLLYPWMT